MNENSTMNNDQWNDEFDLEQAWTQMHELLNKELPVQQHRRKKSAWLWWCRMAAMLIIGVAIAVFTVQFYSSENNNRIAESKPNSGSGKERSKTGKTGSSRQSVPTIVGSSQQPVAAIIGRVTRFIQKIKFTPEQDDRQKYLSRDQLKLIDKFIAEKIIASSNSSINNLNTVNNNIPPRDSASTPAAPAAAKSYRRAGVELGVYYNTGSKVSNIYPVAKYHFPVGKKTSLSAGIALSSTVAPKNFIVKEFMVLNDTANSVYFNVRNTSVNKITYLDLPLQLHYAIDPHWSLSAGLQLSVLQQSNNKSQSQSFDFLSDPVDQVGQTALTMAGYQPYHTYSQEYEIYKTNWRLLAGVSYHIGKASINVQYQGAITNNYKITDFNGEINSSKVGFVSVGAMYKF
ncbi:MAG TPA: outer membrane beta-barrel protein [Chitinophagaceae bacterium]|jgi:hypothetical protein|nr:outer membrane beta-barrel protein [Chitinophagaceae bacterium]